MELNQAQSTFIIILVIAFLATIYILIFGPGGHIARARQEEVKRLETKIKVGGGLEMIDNFIALARAYVKTGRMSDAESAMRKALAMAENEYGKNSKQLSGVIKAYAGILNKMKRNVEADNMKKRLKDLS